MGNIEKINKIALTTDNEIINEAKERIKNYNWIKYSQKIAVVILYTIKSKNISQIELAEKMEVSPQYINKLVKGKEKLNLKTISKIESALDISLIEIILPKANKKPKGKIIKYDFKKSMNKDTYDSYNVVK